jgi:SsrA-binding protein
MPRINDDGKVLANNRKASHDYFLEDTVEAGIVLMGSEIKSIRAGRMDLRDSYVTPERGELWLINTHISTYDQASRENHEPRRPRKLLLHRREIARLLAKAQAKGYTIIPTKVYLKHGRAKVEIALAKGKKQYDKRETIAKRDVDRQIAHALRERERG